MPISDLPPHLILPSHWEAKRPTIIRPAEPALIAASVIPGIGAVAATGPLLELTQVATTTGTAASITIPATAQPGDFAILCANCDAQRYNRSTGQPGWITAAQGGNGTGQGGYICAKVIAAGEPGTSVTTFDTTASGTRVSSMIVYRPNVPIGSFVWVDKGSAYVAGTPADVVLDPTAETDVVIATASASGNGSITGFATENPVFPVKIGPVSSRHLAGHALYNSGPGSTPVSRIVKAQDPGIYSLGIGYYRVKPAA